jgi:hypothetical protein
MNAALATTFADLTRTLQAINPNTLADGWRANLQQVDESAGMIRQYERVLAEKDDRLPSGRRWHSPKYVAYARRMLALHRVKLAEAERRVAAAEAQMTAMGIAFVKPGAR